MPDQPLAAAQVLAFPVAMLVRFWVNHHLLDVLQRPVWRVVKGRSRTYVERILSGARRLRCLNRAPAHVLCSAPHGS